MSLKVIGYCRVSTEEQATTGVSLDVQEDKIRSYCDVKDWELVKVIKDEGISAKDLKRPGIQSILDALPKKVSRAFDGIVVLKLDRLTRSVMDLGILNDLFKKHGVTFISIQEAVDTSTATGELFHNIVMSISQWERKIISERTRDALRYKKRMGQRIGGIPYGYDLSNDRQRLIENDREQKILLAIVDMKSEGGSYRYIATFLNNLKIKTKTGKKWYPATVRSVLGHSTSR